MGILKYFDSETLTVSDERSLELFKEVNQDRSDEEIAKNWKIYFNLEKTLVKKRGDKKSREKGGFRIAEILGDVCDEEMKNVKNTSPDEMEKSFSYCDAGFKWVSCIEEDLKGSKRLYCPDGTEQSKWRTRIKKIGEITQLFNQESSYFWQVIAARDLEKNGDDAFDLTRDLFEKYLKKTKPILDFWLANKILYFKGTKESTDPIIYKGKDLKKFFENYQNEPSYEMQFQNISDGLSHLQSFGYISQSQYKTLFVKVLNDPKLNITSKFDLEVNAYDQGLLE